MRSPDPMTAKRGMRIFLQIIEIKYTFLINGLSERATRRSAFPFPVPFSGAKCQNLPTRSSKDKILCSFYDAHRQLPVIQKMKDRTTMKRWSGQQ